jgi:hypothetical protein
LVVRPVGRSEEGGEEAHGDQVDRAICVHVRAADSTCEVWGMVVGSSVNVNVSVIRVPVCARVSRVYPNSPNVFLPDPVLIRYCTGTAASVVAPDVRGVCCWFQRLDSGVNRLDGLAYWPPLGLLPLLCARPRKRSQRQLYSGGETRGAHTQGFPHCPQPSSNLHAGRRSTPSTARVWIVVRFVCVVRVPLCVRVSRVCPGSPRCLFTGTGTVQAPVLYR